MTAEAQPVPHTDLDTIHDLGERLRQTFRSGRTRPLEWRREQLQALRSLLRENGRALATALHKDFAKPELEAFTTDVAFVVSEVDLALKNLKKWTRPERVRTPMVQQPAKARILREPVGVVLIIAPWNYPVQLLLAPLVGAIAAGNCAVLKPSEITAHTSQLLGELVPRYLDSDCFALVEGAVDETTALLEQRFDHVFYTGNGHVGRIVMEAAAKHLTPVTLELGGKSPCIVAEDAKLDVAARRIAWGKFLNAGQTCVAPDYVLVHESKERELLEALTASVRDFYGADPHKSKDYARIANLRHHRRLVGLLKEAGELVLGGQSDEEDRYLAPTILRDVSPDAQVMSEEIFGPILPVLTYRSLDDALGFVNEREKPLALYLFSEDPAKEEQVLAATSSGGVSVNATIWHLANPNLPFGGVGPSGMGSYHGRAGFEAFSHRKSVLTKSTRMDPKVAYPPYSRLKTALVKRMV